MLPHFRMDLPQDLPQKRIVPVIYRNFKKFLLVSSFYDLLTQAEESMGAKYIYITRVETADGFEIDEEVFCAVVLQYSHCSRFVIHLKTEEDDVER